MAKIRLNKAERVPLTLTPIPKTKEIRGKDIVTYDNVLRLAPNETYKSDDKALIEYLKAYKVKVKYNKETENALKSNDVPYELEWCRTCGGKVQKISYHPVEVEE